MDDGLRLALPPRVNSAREARGWVRRLLGDDPRWDVQTVELLVTELVTNVVLPARSNLTVVVHVWEHRLRIEVHDAADDINVADPRDGSGTTESRRGIAIVSQLADNWGAHRLISTYGTRKVVWFEVEPLATDDERARGRTGREEAAAMSDGRLSSGQP